MATTYTIPNRPSGSDTRSISAIIADFDAVLNAINSYDGGNIQAGTVLAEALADKARLGLSEGGTVRRGKSIIATEESRTNAAYGTLTTPDQVASVVLPTDGLLFVGFQSRWQESVLGAGRAAIFVGANQLKVADNSQVAPVVQEASHNRGASWKALASFTGGLQGADATDPVSYGGDVTTGQVLGRYDGVAGFDLKQAWGPCVIFAAAGTYTVSVQFKSSSGSVTVRERKLWVWTMSF